MKTTTTKLRSEWQGQCTVQSSEFLSIFIWRNYSRQISISNRSSNVSILNFEEVTEVVSPVNLQNVFQGQQRRKRKKSTTVIQLKTSVSAKKFKVNCVKPDEKLGRLYSISLEKLPLKWKFQNHFALSRRRRRCLWSRWSKRKNGSCTFIFSWKNGMRHYRSKREGVQERN